LIAMPVVAKEAVISIESGALCGIANPQLADYISREIRAEHSSGTLSVAGSLPQLVDYLVKSDPQVILLDDELVTGAPLLEFLQQLKDSVPVVLIASFDRQNEVAKLVAAGKVEFVGRQGDYASLAASLVLRHLRAAEAAPSRAASPSTPEGVAEIFRHDINNPLTGILGNAELVLSHSAKLPPADVQRLQTVVELAVRLRETIRRLSDAWEAESHAVKSASRNLPRSRTHTG
jgi:signal transduction histidine kinase